MAVTEGGPALLSAHALLLLAPQRAAARSDHLLLQGRKRALHNGAVAHRGPQDDGGFVFDVARRQRTPTVIPHRLFPAEGRALNGIDAQPSVASPHPHRPASPLT